MEDKEIMRQILESVNKISSNMDSLEDKFDRLKGDVNKLNDKVESIYEMLSDDLARIEDENVENYKSISRLRSTLKRKEII